jgi:hypothetical protein
LDLTVDEPESNTSDYWKTVDKDGDYLFCYHCLDTKGIEVYCCDTIGCHKAVHLECSHAIDKANHKVKSLDPLSDDNWECHYCAGFPGLVSDSLKQFMKLVAKQKKKENTRKPTTTAPTSVSPKKTTRKEPRKEHHQ